MTLAPETLPNDVAVLHAIIVKQAAELEDAKNQLKARDIVIEQLQLNLDKLKRSQFGRSSEKVQRQIDQLELALEDLQTERAAEQAGESAKADDQDEAETKKGKKKRGRKKLPAHLPRERSVLDPGDACPDCGGEVPRLSLATLRALGLELDGRQRLVCDAPSREGDKHAPSTAKPSPTRSLCSKRATCADTNIRADETAGAGKCASNGDSRGGGR